MIAAVVLLSSGVSHAQTVAVAQMSGVVTDESGGALPGAQVQVTQTTTGAVRFVITGSGGEYVLTNLPVGPYKLEVKLDGFTTYEQTGITLQVGASPVVNVSLKLGTLSELVTVEAAATMVEGRSTAVGMVIDEEQMVGLPLNGRQPSQLVLLAGAAVSQPAGLIGSQRQYPSAVAISVAGGTGNSTLYLVDGGYNNDPLNNIGGPMPFPDALQEFKVESGVRPARYGMYPGATVNAVTRSGTNAFHGTGFAFLRHHAFNSRGFFDVTDDGLKRGQTGGTIGGPIIQNKLFFFAGPQFTNERIRPTTTDVFLPTAKMLAGDFSDVMSAQCRGGANRTLGAPFTGNRIDPSRFDPIAMKIVGLLPVSTDPCGRYRFAQPNDSDEIQGVGRLDYNMSKSQRVFGRYYIANYDRKPGYDGKNVLLASGNGLGLDNRVQTLAVGHDWIYTSNLVGATRFSWQRSRILRTQGDQLPTWSGLGVNVFTYTHDPGLNFYNLNVTNGWGGPAFPGRFISTTPELAEDFDWIRGEHSLSFGGMWVRPFLDADGPFQANGNFAFNGQRTGGATAQDRLGIADFLLGAPSSFTQGGSQIVAEKMHYAGAYAQDVWRVNSHFTFNGGLRWEPYLAAKDQNGYTMAFKLDRFLANQRSTVFPNAPAGLIFAGDEGFPDNGANTFNRFAQFAPRAGIVWDPKGDSVQTIRAAVGLYYDSPKLWQYGHHMLNAPYGNTVTAISPSTCAPPNTNGCAINLLNPWTNTPGGDPLAAINYPRQGASVQLPPASVRFPLNGDYVSMPIDADVMRVAQWNVSYQRQLLGRVLLDVTYMGNRTNGIWLGYEENPSVYIPGNCVAGQYGLTAAGPCSNSSAVNLRARRLLTLQNPAQGQYFASVAQTAGGTGHYNGVKFTVEKRLSNGWSLSANYTRSKCINQGEPGTDIVNIFPDPTNPSTNEGPCIVDRPHLFNMATVVMTRGVGPGAINVLTRDWQIGTVFQARSGQPLTPSTTGDSALTSLAATERPLIVAGVDPNLSDPTWNGSHTAFQWFNMAAFAQNTPGLWGNVPKGYLRGPGFWDVDLALSRNIKVATQKIEARVEIFNLLNHVNWGSPIVTLGATNAGAITATNGDMRIMQFALKYNF